MDNIAIGKAYKILYKMYIELFIQITGWNSKETGMFFVVSYSILLVATYAANIFYA